MTNDELLIFLGTDPSDSRDQLAWLSRDQLAWLSGDQLAGLSGDQLAGLSRDQLAGLSRDQLAWLSRDQLAWLSGAQLAGLSGDQLAWLSRDQLAWLSGDQLAWLKELQEKTPKLELPYTQIMQATNGCTANFDMSSWHHSCNTTHCAAGWIVTKAGEAGKTLKREFDTPTAARLILRKSCPADWPLPNFYAKNDAAAAFIRAMAAKEAAL